MMDALSAPRMPVSDGAASPSAAGRADKSEDGGSFSKVLSSSGEQERGASKERKAEDDTASVETEADRPQTKGTTRSADAQMLTIDDALTTTQNRTTFRLGQLHIAIHAVQVFFIDE